MKITQLNSATNMIEDYDNGCSVKILCDPWLVGEEAKDSQQENEVD